MPWRRNHLIKIGVPIRVTRNALTAPAIKASIVGGV
jgi:hypothetical protein